MAWHFRLLTVIACLTGCSSPGFFYTDITLPLTVDMNITPRASEAACGVQRVVREPFTGAGVRAEWAGYAPGQAAQQGGMEVIYYTDVRRESVIGGVWSATTALVYGTRNGGDRAIASGEPPAEVNATSNRRAQCPPG